MPKNYPKQPIALSKTAHHTTKMAHSKVQNGPQLHPKQPIVIIGSLPGFSTAITLAFLQIFGMECVAMILEKNLDNQV